MRRATLNVSQAHAGGNQAEEGSVRTSAGAPGNVTGGSLGIKNYCTLRCFFDLSTLAASAHETYRKQVSGCFL